MSFLDTSKQELHVNVAYYGPALSGRTTNVRYIWEHTNADARSEWGTGFEPFRLVTFYLSLVGLPLIDGAKVVFHLSAIPGHDFYGERTALLLRNVDAIVFVADSQINRTEANLEARDNLTAALDAEGRADVPVVFQHNKCDLPDATPFETLEMLLNPEGFPSVRAVASQGVGVLDTFKAAAKLVLVGLRNGTITQHNMSFLRLPVEPVRLWSAFRSDLASR